MIVTGRGIDPARPPQASSLQPSRAAHRIEFHPVANPATLADNRAAWGRSAR
jgi:hypothetical protein